VELRERFDASADDGAKPSRPLARRLEIDFVYSSFNHTRHGFSNCLQG
jgi:hypothetical protein